MKRSGIALLDSYDIKGEAMQISDIARQYVQQWLPIVAASQLDKNNELEKDFLMKWIDVMDFE